MGRKRRYRSIKLPPVNYEHRGYKTRHTSVSPRGVTTERSRKVPFDNQDIVPEKHFIRPHGGYFRHVDMTTTGQATTKEEAKPYVWRGLANKNARRLELRELKERPDLVDMDIVDRIGKRTFARGTEPPMMYREERDRAS